MSKELLKTYCRNHGVRLWELANASHISEATLSRRLRALTEEDISYFKGIVDEMVKEREEKGL